MEIVDSASYLLLQVSNEIRLNLEKLLVELNLHSGQVLVLESLWKNDCQSQADLVRNLSVTPPTVYNLVIRLAKSGFVELKKCSSDGRIMRVCLTPKGNEVRTAVESRWVDLENLMLSKLSETEKMMFSLLLKKLRAGESV